MRPTLPQALPRDWQPWVGNRTNWRWSTFAWATAMDSICWLIAAFVAPQTERSKLIAFYKKVHPAGPGWTKVRKEAGVSEASAALHGDHMGKATLGWVSGCVVIWSSLFAIGNFLYGRMQSALILTSVFVVSGVVLLWVVNHLWDKDSGAASPALPNKNATN